MDNSLKEQLKELAQARQQYTQKKAELDALREQFNEQHAVLIAEVETLSAAQKEADETCRGVGLVEYLRTKNNKPLQGVEIKLWDTATFDPLEALQWCRVNMPALLTLNSKTYEKVLRERANSKNLREALPDMPGHVTEEPKVSLARDLSGYLVVEEKTS